MEQNRSTRLAVACIDADIAVLEETIENLKIERNEVRKRLLLPCGCGQTHMLQEYALLRTRWCNSRDQWVSGEWQLLCPDKKVRNRLLFSNHNLPYEQRHKFKYDVEAQFKRMFAGVFTESIDIYDEYDKNGHYLKVKWDNSVYIDKNRKEFGLPTDEELKDILRRELVP